MPVAHLRCRDIFDLNPKELCAAGVRLVLADLDNTLARYDEVLPSPALAAWRDALAANGISLFILSNNRRATRVPEFAAALGVPYIARAGKPKPAAFTEAMTRVGATPEQTVMVGDQLFTDMWGAARAGIRGVLVRPIRLAPNPGRYLRYAVELPFRLGIKKGVRL